MLQNLSIQNFRCFHDAHFTGFNQINLLGGQNNAGKTALLEAMYLYAEDATFGALHTISKYRKINVEEISRFLSEKESHNNLFWNEESENEIRFYLDKKMHEDIFLNYEGIKIIKWSNGTIDISEHSYKSTKITFIPTDYRLTGIDLVKAFDKLEMSGQEETLLLALQTIDTSLEKIRSFASNPLSLYIKRKGENYRPISFFGDAMNKMAHYILHIIQAKNGILLIDEIENGIHYTHQIEFWQSLLALAKAFEVQIFATSHSLEMIKAFNEVASQEKYESMTTYFEMVKHAKTGEITMNPMDMQMLKHEISKNNPFRGE